MDDVVRPEEPDPRSRPMLPVNWRGFPPQPPMEEQQRHRPVAQPEPEADGDEEVVRRMSGGGFGSYF